MDQMDNLRARVDALEHHVRTVERRMRWWRSIACGVLVVGLVGLPLSSGTAQYQQPAVIDEKSLKKRLAEIEYKL